MIAADEQRLLAVDAESKRGTWLSDKVPWPQTIAWAPNEAWIAFTVAGAIEGQGLYTYAVDEGTLNAITLPEGAIERAVAWAGMEHLFVVRQLADGGSELWLVPLTSSSADPQRLMSYIRLPRTSSALGWQWQDVIATRVLPAGS